MMRLEDISIRQGAFSLAGISLSVPDRAYAILMGSTGCGKTTLLEIICGLRPVQAGKIFVAGQDVTRWESGDRNIGYVPRDSVLFPSMRVDRQIEFSLEVRRTRARERRQRLDELAELTGIEHILRRYPRNLSGGEKQRVALARALAFRPRLLCLDEPLSALDELTKSQIAGLLKRIHGEQDVSILHVTHNIGEAKQLGTIRFQIENGKVQKVF